MIPRRRFLRIIKKHGGKGVTGSDCHVIECIPLFGRLELVDGKWVKMTFPPNLGGTRDIPKGAVFHHSVIKRMSESKYLPKNQGIEALHQSSPQIDQDG